MKPAISVIVPIYNAELFLSACIDSILSQTFKNFELLLIDDGSQDSSLIICEKYQQNDSRITVIHKSNEGVTATRKLGVEKASGEYICFIDADDIVPENSLSTLYNEHEGADMVIGNYEERDELNSIRPNINKVQVNQLDGLEYIRLQLENKLYHAPWGKIIRKACFNNQTFDIPRSIFRGEDLIMNVRLGLNMKNIRILKATVYHYIVRPSSCMQTRKPTLEYEKIFDKHLMQPLIEKQLEDKLKASILSQRMGSLIGLLLENIPVDNKDSYVYNIDSQLKFSSFDLKQILLKIGLSYPFLFRFLYRVCRKLSMITT